MTKGDKLNMVNGIIGLLREAEFYEGAISHASYAKGMIAMLMADGTLEAGEWTALYEEIESILKPKYKLKSITEQGAPF